MSKILIVEDDPFIMIWVEDALRDAGFSPLSATNADVAIRYLETNDDISLVFTDIDMPGSMDGLALAAAVRRRWPPVHLIIASGKHRPRVDEMPTKAIFVPKPYLSRDVLVAVNSFH